MYVSGPSIDHVYMIMNGNMADILLGMF